MSVIIHKIILAEQPPMRDMFQRVYQSTWNDRMGDILMETTRDGHSITPESVIPVAGSILRPRTQVMEQDRVQIANGFSTQRLAVTIVMETGSSQLQRNIEVVSGYTDYYGISMIHGKETVDRNMRLFLNNTSMMNQQLGAIGHSGYGQGINIMDSTQVLTPLAGWDANHEVPILKANATTMRPEDVFTAFSYGAGGGALMLADSRTQFSGRPKRSRRTANMNNHYLSDVLLQYRKSQHDPEVASNSDYNSFNRVADHLANPLASNDPFLAMARERGYSSEWSISWADLIAMDPSMTHDDDRITLVRLNDTDLMGRLSDTENWTDARPNCQVAQMVLNIIPGLIIEFGIGSLDFVLHNKTIGGRPFARITHMVSAATGVKVDHLLDIIEERLSGVVFHQLSNGGVMDLDILARVSMSGLSHISVGVNGSEMVPYSAPMYCDALYAPVLAADSDSLIALANDLGRTAAAFTAKTPYPTPLVTDSLGGYANSPSPVDYGGEQQYASQPYPVSVDVGEQPYPGNGYQQVDFQIDFKTKF